MAGSQKEFELLFKLKASLGGNFNSTFKSAINTNNQLRDSLKNVNSLQSKIDGYTKQSAAIDKNKERLAQLNAEHDRLQQELQQPCGRSLKRMKTRYNRPLPKSKNRKNN